MSDDLVRTAREWLAQLPVDLEVKHTITRVLVEKLCDRVESLDADNKGLKARLAAPSFDTQNVGKTSHNGGDRMLRLNEVSQRVGLGRSSIYEFVKKKRFPAPVKLSSHCTRWRESDIAAWISTQSQKG